MRVHNTTPLLERERFDSKMTEMNIVDEENYYQRRASNVLLTYDEFAGSASTPSDSLVNLDPDHMFFEDNYALLDDF